LKLHLALITKKRLLELGWEVKLEHQEECPEHSHWCLTTNIPYKGVSWVNCEGKRVGGGFYKEWREWFTKRERFVRFLKRYYPHHVNFWIWEDLEDAIAYEDAHIYKAALHNYFPCRR
jgi:hypothetical protein